MRRLDWRCQRCRRQLDGNPKCCPHCSYTVYDPVWSEVDDPVAHIEAELAEQIAITISRAHADGSVSSEVWTVTSELEQRLRAILPPETLMSVLSPSGEASEKAAADTLLIHYTGS